MDFLQTFSQTELLSDYCRFSCCKKCNIAGGQNLPNRFFILYFEARGSLGTDRLFRDSFYIKKETERMLLPAYVPSLKLLIFLFLSDDPLDTLERQIILLGKAVHAFTF